MTVIATGLPLAAPALHAEGVQISGGLDLRFVDENNPRSSEFKVEGAFINLRKVWSDDFGDRWILVGQADFDDNFERIRPYQLSLQYKGPLGKWNIRGGHYLLPFGLLATYDTERLILQGLERIGLGIRKDTGAMVFGHIGNWDYAVSVSDGLSDVRFVDSRANPVFTGRLAYVRDDWQIGFSSLAGRVLLDPNFGIGEGMVRERRFALDATKPFGPLLVRAEAVAGTDNGRAVGGAIVLSDYAIRPRLELNTRYQYWRRNRRWHSAGLGLSYRLRKGLFLRVADIYDFGQLEKNAFTVQVYYEFSKHF
jgi:hypothetical protein